LGRREWRPHGAEHKGCDKAEAVSRVATAAKKGSEPVSVRIHKTDGKIQEERTYLRSADPPWSKG
jgi:hypothetical protein